MGEVNNSDLSTTFKSLDALALKKLPDLQRDEQLANMANQINDTHIQIEDHAKTVLTIGTAAIEQAIACGRWLRTIKATLRHGQFEAWCEKHLKFKIRKAQYYMVLAHRFTGKKLQHLQPQSFRQALIYAGALPVDPDKKHRPAKFDEWAPLRKSVGRVLLTLRASADYDPKQAIRETEPLFEWRQELLRRLAEATKPVGFVEIQTVIDAPSSKTQHDAFLPTGSEKFEAQHPALMEIATEPAERSAIKEIQDKVVAFRLSVRMRIALEDYHKAHPDFGVRSSADLARKVVIDFIQGRLSYAKTTKEGQP